MELLGKRRLLSVIERHLRPISPEEFQTLKSHDFQSPRGQGLKDPIDPTLPLHRILREDLLEPSRHLAKGFPVGLIHTHPIGSILEDLGQRFSRVGTTSDRRKSCPG